MTDFELEDDLQFCPECETPNQFGEMCHRCTVDLQEQAFSDDGVEL